MSSDYRRIPPPHNVEPIEAAAKRASLVQPPKKMSAAHGGFAPFGVTNPSAMQAQRRLVSQLLRSGEAYAELASILEACSPVAPCRSVACPICAAAFQQAAVSAAERFITGPARSSRGRKHALTIVPTTGCLAPDSLTVAECRRTDTEILDALAALNLPPMIVHFELSFNEDTTGVVEDHWCRHAHCTGLEWPSKAHIANLKKAFPASKFSKRPILWEPLDDDPRGLAYPPKWQKARRVTVLVTDDPTRAPYRDTKDRPLRPWQAVSLAVVEHELGFRQRLQTHAIDGDAVWQHLEALGWPRDGD